MSYSFRTTIFSERRRIIFLLLLIYNVQIALSQTLSDHYQSGPSWYVHDGQASAQTECEGLGMNLCSSTQLFRIVYSDVDGFSASDLCFAGYTSDTDPIYQLGWFNSEEGTCGETGWKPADWVSETGWGAHCCSGFTGVAINTCAATFPGPCPSGFISVSNPANTYCPSGTCDTDACCYAWQPAPLYRSVGGYEYNTLELAEDACQQEHPDLHVCTADQLVGLADNGGWFSCSAGWYVSDADGNGDRAFYLAEEFTQDGSNYQGTDASGNTAGDCGNSAGWQTWKPADNYGSAHCCVASYHNSDYGTLGDAGYDYTLTDAQAYCAGQLYPKQVCTQAQVRTVVNIEQTHICRSSITLASSDATETSFGWYDNSNCCGDCLTWQVGFLSWAPTPAASCCLSYVVEAGNDPYSQLPVSLSYNDGYTTGTAAVNACQAAGYDDLCTMGQQITVENDVDTNVNCAVGWVYSSDAKDAFDAGFWANCGAPDTWHNNNEWMGDTLFPLAHCCNSDITSTNVVAPAYYNGDWDYSYTDLSAAADMCTDGYSICSRAQVYEIAVNGATLSDGSTQIEDDICRLGWYSDGTKGWYQNCDSCGCGTIGWHTYESSGATYHCCSDDLEVSATTTPPPTDPPIDTSGVDTQTQLQNTMGPCQEGDVSIVDGTAYYHDGSDWAPICAHYFGIYSWETSAMGATAVCQKLGYSSGTTVDAGVSADNAAFIGYCDNVDEFPVCSPEVSNPCLVTSPTVTIACDGDTSITQASCVTPAPTTQEPTTSDPTAAAATPEPTLATLEPTDATPEPTTADPTATVWLCNNYKFVSDDAPTEAFAGVYAPTSTDDTWFQPSQYNREYETADRIVSFTGTGWQFLKQDLGFAAASGSAQDAIQGTLTWTYTWNDLSTGTFTSTQTCVEEPPYREYRDADAAAMFMVPLVAMAYQTRQYCDGNEVDASLLTTPFSVLESTCDTTSTLDSELSNMLILLENSFIKFECRPVFGALTDVSGNIDETAFSSFLAGGANDGSCLSVDYSTLESLRSQPDAEEWNGCSGTNKYSTQGYECALWTSVLGVTSNREDAGTATDGANVINIVNSFMTRFLNGYAPDLTSYFSGADTSTIDLVHYVNKLNEASTTCASSSDFYAPPDGWYPCVDFPQPSACEFCSTDADTLISYTRTFYSDSTVSDDDVSTALASYGPVISDFSESPSMAPTVDMCPYVTLYQEAGATPFDGLYERGQGTLFGKFFFVNADLGTIRSDNEVWIIDDSDDSYTFSSQLPIPDDWNYPPALDTWTHYFTNDGSYTHYENVHITCDAGDYWNIGGGVVGLISGTGEVITLTNANGGEVLEITDSGVFFFITEWFNNAWYSVSMSTTGGLDCILTNNEGNINGTDVLDITVACDRLEFTVGGSISGLLDNDAATLTLSDGSGQFLEEVIITADGTFTFSNLFFNFDSYSVTIDDDTPVYYECTPTNNVGSLAGADVTDVSFVCAITSYSLSGSYSLPTSLGSVDAQLVTVSSVDSSETVVETLTLTAYRADSSGSFSFSTELTRGAEWIVYITNINGYSGCTPTSYTGVSIQADVTTLNIACDYEFDCVQEPWMSDLVVDGFPSAIFDQLCLVNTEYYFGPAGSQLATCVAGNSDADAVCDGEAAVCSGLLGSRYGTMSRQADNLIQALGIEDGCLASGNQCSTGDSCCDPQEECYWTVDTLGFVRRCINHDDCVDSLNDCQEGLTSYQHPMCPPSVCNPQDSSTILSSNPQSLFSAEVFYCESDGTYYMNGMTTCETASANLATTFWDDFEFGMDMCSDILRDFDVILDDQVYLVNTVAQSYQGRATALVEDCCIDSSDYDTLIADWPSYISTIENAETSYSSDVNAQLAAIADSAQELLDILGN